MREGEIKVRKFEVQILGPKKLSRSLRKKVRTTMRKKAYTDSVELQGDRIVCLLNRSANNLAPQRILQPIAEQIHQNGSSSRHRRSPCYIKQRRRTRPAVTQRNARSKKKGNK